MIRLKIKSILKDFAIILVCIAVMAYVIIHLSINFTKEISVEPALMVTLEDPFITDGYIMRREVPIFLDKEGLIVPSVAEGGRVALGDALFSIYEGENDAETESRIREIDQKIAVLQRSTSESGSFVTDMGRLDDDIASSVTELLQHMAQNSVSRAESRTDDILVNMNKRWLITNAKTSFEEKIAELEQQKTELQGSLAGNASRFYSKMSGYFSSALDGYEEIFNPLTLDTLTVEKFVEMTKKQPDTNITENASGKVITNFKWNVLCHVSKEDASDFEKGESYPVVFPFSYNTEINMTLSDIVTHSDSDGAVLVFVSTSMPDGFNYERKQEIEIIRSRKTGLGVKKSAMRVIDGKKGVYILTGNSVRFKYAEELCEADDYYIIDSTEKSYLDINGTPKCSASERLELYDSVITEGKNIYEGKIVE